MTLRLHVLRDGRWIRSVPVETLPFSIGSKTSADLVLEDPDVHPKAGRVVLGHDGVPEFLGQGGGQRVPLNEGVHFRLGPFLLAVGPGDSGSGGDAAAVLTTVLERLPGLWDEETGRPDPEALLELLRELFGAAWGALVRLPEEGEPQVLAQSGERPGGDVPLSRTVLTRVMQAEEPILVEPGLEDEGGAEVASIPVEVRSVLAAPLKRGGRREGVVYLESPRSRKIFRSEERATLVALCDFAGAHLASLEVAHRERTRGAALGQLYRRELAGHQELEGIVGRSPVMRAVVEQVRQAGPTDVTTLIRGESGTGKELVAGALHRLSRRSAGPFVAVNCSALPSELVESELFGHRKGAFSGAVEDRIGRFQMADGGTLFLDELGDLPLPAQAKLLRVLESRRVQRLGDSVEEPVDVRIVAATRIDLAAEVEAGRFREDLFFRLGVFTIELPPLRERPEDIPDLVESLVPLLGRLHGRPIQGVSAQALELLRHHDWPGNVRELRNLLEQAMVRTTGEWIQAGALGLRAPAGAPGEGEYTFPDELEAARALFEREHIARCLRQEKGDVARVAERLGMARSSLYKRLKEYHLDPASFRGQGAPSGSSP